MAGGTPEEGLSMASRYIERHQARTRAPTPYDDALGDALEAAFARNIHDVSGLVAALNAAGIRTPDGGPWTEENFPAVMHRLAESH
jgi:hypothetical protein